MEVNAQQFGAITSVESIVPNGIGRSRIVNTMEEKDYKAYILFKQIRTIPEINLSVMKFE